MIVRVAELGKPAFQLRPGEKGISVFDPDAVDPALTDDEVLQDFRPGSVLIKRAKNDVYSKNLQIVFVPGAPDLPLRLQNAHAEIRPHPTLTRKEFKLALKELE